MKTDATHKVTRLEIIDDGGRGYVNMRAGGIEMSLQDDDRTMKIFTKGRSNASDERMYTRSEVEQLVKTLRTAFNVIDELNAEGFGPLTSKEGLDAFSALVDALGVFDPA